MSKVFNEKKCGDKPRYLKSEIIEFAKKYKLDTSGTSKDICIRIKQHLKEEGKTIPKEVKKVIDEVKESENEKVKDIKKYTPIIEYDLSDVRTQCINYDSKIHDDPSDIIVYEESYKGITKRYCFSIKNDIINLLTNNLNPITGRLFSLDFITLLREKYGTATIGKLIEPSDFNTEDCTVCEDENKCKSNVVLSDDVIKWLQFYISQTYMVDLKHHVIPYNVRKELLKVKKCNDYTNLLRGVSFGLVSIPYYIKYLKMEKGQEFKEEYIKPVSTTIDPDVANGFSKKGIFGVCIKFTKVKKSDVLVDLNLISLGKNKFGMMTGETIIEEKEVILLPGLYKQKIVSVYDKNNYNLTIDQLTRLYDIFKNDIRKESKSYKFREFRISKNSIITFESDTCNVKIYPDKIVQKVDGEVFKKKFNNFDKLLDYLKDQLDFLFMPVYVSEDIRNITDVRKRYIKIIIERIKYIGDIASVKQQAESTKILFDYIIKNNVLSVLDSPKVNSVLKEKLDEFEGEDIPGPYNPKDWVPIVRNKLFPKDLS